MKNGMRRALIVGAMIVFGVAAACAQDKPSEGVARVSLVRGDVSTQRGDSGEWVAATVNAPLVTGDSIATGDRSRAEVQLDYANIIRLGPNSDVKIAGLTHGGIQVQVPQGIADYVVIGKSDATSEADTPNVAVEPLGEGTYRIQVDSSQQSEVIVRKGDAQVSTPQGSTTVHEGDLITIQGTNNPEYQITRAPGRDEWDQWNRDRDRAILDAQSWRYTNHYYTGAADLDSYGHWVYVPGYDWCWTPYVDAGWVPYRFGRWDWEPWWGWTWDSYEPWGWAPYHYGRWFFYGGGWDWWPGYVTPYYYPVWAPAYVSFFGFGFGHFGFGFGFNSIGWCPLGPVDPFYPWWGFGNRFTVVNITNINVGGATTLTTRRFAGGRGHEFFASNLRGALVNANVRRAITTVSTRDFVAGRIPRNVATVNPVILRQASVMKGRLPAVPTRQSLGPSGRNVRIPAVARASANTQFFTRHSVTAPQPMSFSRQQAAIRQMVQTHNPMIAMNRNGAAPRAGVAARAFGTGFAAQRSQTPHTSNERAPVSRRAPAAGQSSSPGWQRFGNTQPARPAPSQGRVERTQSAPTPQNGGSAWRRFSNGPQASHPQAAPPNRTEFRAQSAPLGGRGSSGGWQRFTPQSRPAPQGYNAPRDQGKRSGWSRFSEAPRGGGAYSNSRGGREFRSAPRSERPPLRLNKPIVVRRNTHSDYASGGWGRAYSTAPGNRGNYGGYSTAPSNRGWSRGSYGGRYYSGRAYSTAPSNRGWSGGGYSRGGGNAPRGGGGYSRGGYSGGRSYSRGGGGGRSFHASAPRGGGGHFRR